MEAACWLRIITMMALIAFAQDTSLMQAAAAHIIAEMLTVKGGPRTGSYSGQRKMDSNIDNRQELVP